MELPLHTEFWLDIVVAILLLVTVGYCLMLNRRLSALRGSQAEMRKLLADFAAATQAAENSVGHLKVASDHIGATLDQRITEARALADELGSITQSGGRLAERIESGLVGRPSPGRSRPDVRGPNNGETGGGGIDPSGRKPDLEREKAPGPLSESERELAEILRRARS
jgi:hypothetical protein